MRDTHLENLCHKFQQDVEKHVKNELYLVGKSGVWDNVQLSDARLQVEQIGYDGQGVLAMKFVISLKWIVYFA